MKTIKLSTEQQLLIIQLVREEINHKRIQLRYAKPLLHNFYIKELCRLRGICYAILEANDLKKAIGE
jgi:hypothetical protein